MTTNKTGDAAEAYIVVAKHNGVTTLTMNRPRRFNGWTEGMMDALTAALSAAAADGQTKAVILTGRGRYYCAGVNLGGTLKLGHPGKLHAMIVARNQGLFDMFLDFPKPILVAANGPVIGAAVTSATLCDGIIAAHNATFSTPFAALSITPEGCSSVHFERIMGAETAQRMLGKEGWKPTAEEAAEAGLIQWAVAPEELMNEAQRIAEGWIAEGKRRSFRGPGELAALKAVNARESIGVADSFLSAPFMKAQYKFLWSKGKRGPALFFRVLAASRPLWAHLLPGRS